MAVATPCWPAPVSAMTPLLAHAHGEQGLAEDVVDLVGAGVAEILALEVDPRAAAVLAEPRGEVERRGAAGVVARAGSRRRALERAVAPRRGVGALQLDQRRHQRLGDEAAAVSARSGPARRAARLRAHHRAPRLGRRSAQTLSGSLRPGAASTPEVTSTAYGRTVATAARHTLSGVSPAERDQRHCGSVRSRGPRARRSAGAASPSLQRAALSSRMAATRSR